MATQRHSGSGLRALVVSGTCAGLVLAATVPAQASVPPSGSADLRVAVAAPSAHGLSPLRAVALARRVAVAQARGDAAAVRQAALARTAALRAAAARRAAAAARQAAATPPAASAPAAPVAAVVAAPADPTPVAAPVTPVPAPLAPVVDPVVPSSTSPSGQAAPRGDLPGWKQTYVEDFGTPVATGAWPGAYDAHWYAYSDGIKDTSKNGTYMPSKVLSVHDGVLDYSISTVNGVHQVSAPVVKDTYGQVYGRYSVRFKSDSLPGYKNAWLLWPDSGRWPDHGEIDFPEGDLDSGITAFSHWANPAGGQDEFGTGASFRDWHTATIEWLPGKVTFTLDGHVVGSSTRDVPTTAMHWVLQTETALSGGAPAAGVAGHVLVDWVALYTRA